MVRVRPVAGIEMGGANTRYTSQCSLSAKHEIGILSGIPGIQDGERGMGISIFRYADVDIYICISKCGYVIGISRDKYLYMDTFRRPGVPAIAC